MAPHLGAPSLPYRHAPTPAPPHSPDRNRSTGPRRVTAIAPSRLPVLPGAARRAANTHGRTHPVLGLQVGAAVQQQLRRVLVATGRSLSKRRSTILRGRVPSKTTVRTAYDRRRVTLAAQRHAARFAAGSIACTVDTPHVFQRGSWRSSPSSVRKAVCWLHRSPFRWQRAGNEPTASTLTAASFFQSTGAPSSSSLRASAVFPALAASQSALAIALSSIAGVAMLSDARGAGRALAGRAGEQRRSLAGFAEAGYAPNLDDLIFVRRRRFFPDKTEEPHASVSALSWAARLPHSVMVLPPA